MLKCFNICKLLSYRTGETRISVENKNNEIQLIHITKTSSIDFLFTEFIKIEKISEGGFGIIYKVTDYENNVYILKKLINNFQNEIQKYNIFYSPYIIKAYKIYKLYDKSGLYKYYILLHYYPYGDLFTRLILKGKFSEENTKTIIKKIIYPLLIFKKKNYVHLDIKLENYVIEKKLPLYSKNNKFILIDLGSIHKYKKTKKLYSLKYSVGTKKYMPPEILKYSNFCSNSDVWSIGIITYELLTGYTFNIDQLRNYKFDIYNILKLSDFSNLCKRFIISTIQPYNKRIEIDKLYKHKWLKN